MLFSTTTRSRVLPANRSSASKTHVLSFSTGISHRSLPLLPTRLGTPSRRIPLGHLRHTRPLLGPLSPAFTFPRHYSSGLMGGSSGTPFVDIFDQMGATQQLRVESYNHLGFTLNNGTMINGPVFLVQNHAFAWNVPSKSALREWRKNTLQILELLSPKPDILVVGTGGRFEPVPKDMEKYLRSLGIQLEITDTRNACANHALLAQEGRQVAALLLPQV
ncbi:hypothetical protein IWQ61_007004 [Dispira simplex]|nr:hypothetical protein IWQ61_007004 [Dispira simplex]